jgi:hypothetical protein
MRQIGKPGDDRRREIHIAPLAALGTPEDRTTPVEVYVIPVELYRSAMRAPVPTRKVSSGRRCGAAAVTRRLNSPGNT